MEASKNFCYHVCECNRKDREIEDLVKSFYSLDSVGIIHSDPLISKDDERSLQLLKKFVRYRDDGHFETPLLWKFDILNLPDSYPMAMKRLLCLERKLKENSELLDVFRNTIVKYISKGYIRKLSAEEISTHQRVWYLPIFAVFNKNKPGKSRVVWDAAAKVSGVSLNSFLLKGPDMLASLPKVLFAFRERKVAVCGDIEEMFHQIYVRQEDRDVQRFLWRDCNPTAEPDVYVMDVMIFGASCAPSISQFIKNLNAERFEKEYPLAVKSIKRNHYVDDLLTSCDTSQEAIKLISQIKNIHQKGGFYIRNWISNSKEVLNGLSDSLGSNNSKCLNPKDTNLIEKVLGVFWDHEEDVITFKISQWLLDSDIFHKRCPTKREMLRIVMSIFDPLGLIGNIIMYVKTLLQEVWRSKTEWDEEISPVLSSKWRQWIDVLPSVQHIKIPRCYLQVFSDYNNTDINLHTFVDASKDGYAAVCYLRLLKGNKVTCSLVGSKTRVAPLKITSVPRLELMAALIGARYSKYICDNHEIKISKKIFWSDSKTVLSWINSDHRKYSQFVAFRITEILELTSTKDWRYTPSKQNVADEATKWSRIPRVDSCSRWFIGPEMLYQDESNWPRTSTEFTDTNEEMKHHAFKITMPNELIDYSRFSKWKRLVRATAYTLRFVNYIRCRKIQKGELTQEELATAINLLTRKAQQEKYFNEISCLQAGGVIPKSSDIYKKSPYLDPNGVLRIDGRIDYAKIPDEQKSPIILPKSSYITSLLMMDYHVKFQHMNHETAVNEIRQLFSINKLRTAYKHVVRNCQWCKVYKGKPNAPQMAKLPRARLASSESPFTYTGLDFFGPLIVTVGRHREKRYGCLFTCLTVRAVHIEFVHSLNTSSCILAIRNFMSRR